MRFFSIILMLGACVLTFRAAADDLDCARCHQNPAMTPSVKNELGVPRSLYIDPEAFKESWHYRFGEKTECVMCHRAIKSYPHERDKTLRCSDCHPEAKKPEFLAIEKTVADSIHRRLDCNECHDVHSNKPAEAMTLTEKNRGCLKCHEYGLGPGRYAALEPIPIETYHTWHPRARLHLERMACIVCHTTMNPTDEGTDIAEADKHLIRDKSHATRTCSICHSGDSKVAEYLIDVGPDAKSGADREDLLRRIYLVGGTREPMIEIIGGSILLLSIIGVFGHGAGRALFFRRRGS